MHGTLLKLQTILSERVGVLPCFCRAFIVELSIAECLACWMHTLTHTHYKQKQRKLQQFTHNPKHTHILFLQPMKSQPWICCNCQCLCFTSRAFDNVLDALTCLLNGGKKSLPPLLPIKASTLAEGNGMTRIHETGPKKLSERGIKTRFQMSSKQTNGERNTRE